MLWTLQYNVYFATVVFKGNVDNKKDILCIYPYIYHFFWSSFVCVRCFLASVILFQPEVLPLVFLVMQSYWQWTISIFLYAKMSFSTNFWRISFLDTEFCMDRISFSFYLLCQQFIYDVGLLKKFMLLEVFLFPKLGSFLSLFI